MGFPSVPTLCSEKACPFKAFIFKYIEPYLIPGKRKKWKPVMCSPSIIGFCILHKDKVNKISFVGTIYKSRKELDGLALADRVIKE